MSQQDLVQFKYELKPPYEDPGQGTHYKNCKFTILIGNEKITITVPLCITLDEKTGIIWETTEGSYTLEECKNGWIQEGYACLEDNAFTKVRFSLLRNPLRDFLIEIQSQSGKNCGRYLKQLSDPDFKYV